MQGFIETARSASAILAIDGCPTDCAMTTLENAGLHNVKHLRLADLGFRKGSSPATSENVDRAAEHGNAVIG
jgi:uncharacterized metal-binding protein